MKEKSLWNTTAVVTGATGAIGRATVNALMARGANVAALGRNRERLHALGSERVQPWQADCTDAARLAAVAEEVSSALGPPRLLFVFAGGDGFPVPTAEETAEHWRAVLESDLTSAFVTISAFSPALSSHETSAIVLMASTAGRRAGRSNAAYAAAKSGIVGLTRHLARELAPAGVRINCLAPGTVDNDRIAALPDEQRSRIAGAAPLGVIASPDEVTRAALFLAAPESATMTGAVLDIDGGLAA